VSAPACVNADARLGRLRGAASSFRLACRAAFRCRGRPFSSACAWPVCPEGRQLAERALAQHTAMTVAAGHGLRRNPDL